MRRVFPFFLAASATALLGCPKLLKKAQPDAPTASQTLDGEETKRACAAGKLEYGKPLIVDLPSAERGDLEVAMRDGIVVAHYDCKELTILPDCHAPGSYAFTGFTPKEEVVRLADEDELGANLPISAGPLGAKLGGDFKRGMTLDIALMMIGKRRTTRKTAARGELVSDRPNACAKATHFVRGAFVGAFAMTTGTKAEARGAAEIFGIPQLGKIGIDKGASTSKEVATKDGTVDACKGASPDAEAAPGGCGALVRLELVVIDDSFKMSDGYDASAKPQPEDPNGADACAAGFVQQGGKCAHASADATHLCKPDDIADCRTQCERGDAGSCSRMGYYHQAGKGVPKDLGKAASLYQTACDKGWPVGCASLGALYVLGEGVGRDPEKGIALVQKACEADQPAFCTFLGQALYVGNSVPKDPARAARFLRLGCDGGASGGCFLMGELSRKGTGGIAKDPQRARGYYRKGCDGRDPLSCFGLAVALDEGIGGAKDQAAAKKLFKKLCDGGLKEACASAK